MALDDLHRAVFVALSVANIPPSGWDAQIFTKHVKRAGTVSKHQPQMPAGNIATLSFVIADGTTNRTVTGTANILNGNTTLSIDGAAPAPPTGTDLIIAGFEASGSQIWFNYNDAAGVFQQYRVHTNTNLKFLANVLHLNGLPALAQIILQFIGL